MVTPRNGVAKRDHPTPTSGTKQPHKTARGEEADPVSAAADMEFAN